MYPETFSKALLKAFEKSFVIHATLYFQKVMRAFFLGTHSSRFAVDEVSR
jgi:hypothetical protein